jgi:hypothetical protein
MKTVPELNAQLIRVIRQHGAASPEATLPP